MGVFLLIDVSACLRGFRRESAKPTRSRPEEFTDGRDPSIVFSVTQTGCAENDGGGDDVGSESDSVGQGLELGTPLPKTLTDLEGGADETAWNAIMGNR